eukprot:scaffold186148_cov27-Tisochrysis_lutea.AAC.1
MSADGSLGLASAPASSSDGSSAIMRILRERRLRLSSCGGASRLRSRSESSSVGTSGRTSPSSPSSSLSPSCGEEEEEV